MKIGVHGVAGRCHGMVNMCEAEWTTGRFRKWRGQKLPQNLYIAAGIDNVSISLREHANIRAELSPVSPLSPLFTEISERDPVVVTE